MFSGILPTPAGEESLDHWLEQARLMFEECDRSDREKRQRIVESLNNNSGCTADASPDCYV